MDNCDRCNNKMEPEFLTDGALDAFLCGGCGMLRIYITEKTKWYSGAAQSCNKFAAGGLANKGDININFDRDTHAEDAVNYYILNSHKIFKNVEI